MSTPHASSHELLRRSWRNWPRLAAAGLLLTASACNSPGRGPLRAFNGRDRAVQHAYRDERQPAQHQVQPLTHDVASDEELIVRPQSPDVGLVSVPDAVAQPPGPLQKLNSSSANARGEPVIVHAAVPRESLANQVVAPVQPAAYQQQIPIDPNCPTGACPPLVMMPCVMPEDFADEYICDGGDLNLPVHYEGLFRAGLDTEDTVAEFQDEFGRSYVKPSTRICIYAPRFAAVRTFSLPHEGLQVNRAGGHHEAFPVAAVAARVVLETSVKNDELLGLNTLGRASGVDMDLGGVNVTGVISPERHIKLLNVFQNLGFQPGHQLDGNISALIGLASRNAAEWAQDRTAIVIAKDTSDQIVMGRAYAQDYTAVELRDSAGDLTICKLADKGSAQPGDVVTFTIRFDNVGGRPLRNVRVVDNLSPRLEFVAGSVHCSLDGQVHTEPTSGGSTLLTFEFDQPLEPKTGGVLTFECRVR